MDISKNSGPTEADCVFPPSSGTQSSEYNENMKDDNVFTVAVMAPEIVYVPAPDLGQMEQASDNSQAPDVADISCQTRSPKIIKTIVEKPEDYYQHILVYLKNQTLPPELNLAQRTLISRRSRHYTIKDGELFHGVKQPKRVIIDVEARTNLLNEIHIDSTSGVHLGVQKMHTVLKKNYFWCSMYVDVTNFVRKCDSCIETSGLAPSQVKSEELKRRIKNIKKNLATEDTRTAMFFLEKASNTWKKVEVRLSGPYSGERFILTISDPNSRWVEAKVVTEPDLGLQAADFVLATFCQLGFALFSSVGFSHNQRVDLEKTYQSELTYFLEVLTGLTLKEHKFACHKLSKCLGDDVLCPWVAEVLMSLLQQYPDSWASQLPKFLFGYSSTIPKEKFKRRTKTPFQLMFGRDPIIPIPLESREKLALRPLSQRIKLQNYGLKTCAMDMIKEPPSSKDFTFSKQTKTAAACSDKSDDDDDTDENEDNSGESENEEQDKSAKERKSTDNPELRANTVAAVQALLASTRKERSRRGHYQRYTTEQRDLMALYALQHGSFAAVEHFTHQFGYAVSESTIRNFAKNYENYTQDMQEEIGAYATKNNADDTIAHIRTKYDREMRPSLVRKFKARYLSKYPELAKTLSHGNTGKKKKNLDPLVKKEIGEYAIQFGVTEAAEHYSEKLKSPVKESTVKRLKKAMKEKYKSDEAKVVMEEENQQTQQFPEHIQEHIPESIQMDTMEVVQASFNVLNTNPSAQTLVYNNQTYQPILTPLTFQPQIHHSTINHDTPYTQQPLPTVITHNQQLVFSQPTFQTHSGYVNTGTFSQLQPTNIHMSPDSSQSLLAAPSEHTGMQCGNSQIVVSQHPLLISQHQQQDNNIGVHLEHQLSLSGFDTNIPNQLQDSQGAINFMQPSNVSYEHPVQADNLYTHEPQNEEQQQHNVDDSNIEMAVNSNTSQVIQAINVNCEELPNLTLLQEPSASDSKDAETSTEFSSSKYMPNETSTPSSSTSFKNIPEKTNFKSKRNTANTLKKKKTEKRKNYTTYSPELRAEIGRFAAENGNQQTIVYFRSKVGHNIPESTVRGLKDKYVTKLASIAKGKKKDSTMVTSLGFAPRGRPMRLGKYDEEVRKCIQELVLHGERVTAFLVITTAKQVLQEREPSMLAENGGSINLTKNWAKSFLKRIGIHNNS